MTKKFIYAINLLGLLQKKMYDLHEYLSPVNVAALNNDSAYNDSQLANFIKIHETDLPDLTEVDIVIAGIDELKTII